MNTDPKTYYDAAYSKVGRSAKAVEALCYSEKHQQQRRETTRQVLRGLVKPGMAVLELGCAGGWWTAEMAPTVGSVVAVDVVQWLLDQAPRFENVEYRCQDWNALRFPAGSFDLILALNVFEHEVRIGALIGKLYRWARPGCKMLATVPVSEKLQRAEIAFDPNGVIEKRVAGHGSGHVHAFRPDTFDPLLTAAGWEIETRKGDGIYYLVVATRPGDPEPEPVVETVTVDEAQTVTIDEAQSWSDTDSVPYVREDDE